MTDTTTTTKFLCEDAFWYSDGNTYPVQFRPNGTVSFFDLKGEQMVTNASYTVSGTNVTIRTFKGDIDLTISTIDDGTSCLRDRNGREFAISKQTEITRKIPLAKYDKKKQDECELVPDLIVVQNQFGSCLPTRHWRLSKGTHETSKTIRFTIRGDILELQTQYNIPVKIGNWRCCEEDETLAFYQSPNRLRPVHEYKTLETVQMTFDFEEHVVNMYLMVDPKDSSKIYMQQGRTMFNVVNGEVTLIDISGRKGYFAERAL